MGKIALRNHKGFTLIELLAVMAIVAVLAGIVSITVSGSGESSRDTQTRQDATTIQSAAVEFFSAQVAAETLGSKTVTLLGQDNFVQTTSTRWPEDYVSSAYGAVFPENDLTTVASIIFLDKDGTLSGLSVRGLVQGFNAIDFNALLGGEFLAELPENANRTSEGFNDYLWLLEKGTAAGGSGGRASRKVAVFKLVSVEISETSNLVDLTYRRLVGEDFSGKLPVALVFQDDFEAETLGTQSLTKWTVTPTTSGIDVIGPGFADEYPGNGLYLDMAGCTNGTITSPSLTLAPGTYQLSFEIGNNPASTLSDNALLVSLGGLFNQSFTAPAVLTLTTKTIVVTTPTTASLVFQETGASNCGGSVLDDVLLILLAEP